MFTLRLRFACRERFHFLTGRETRAGKEPAEGEGAADSNAFLLLQNLVGLSSTHFLRVTRRKYLVAVRLQIPVRYCAHANSLTRINQISHNRTVWVRLVKSLDALIDRHVILQHFAHILPPLIALPTRYYTAGIDTTLPAKLFPNCPII